MIENFQKILNSKDFDAMKSDLEERLRDKKEAMNYGMEVYNDQISGWIMIGIKWNFLRFVYEDFFKYHGYKVGDNGQITKLTEGGEERKKDDLIGTTTQFNNRKWSDFAKKFH